MNKIKNILNNIFFETPNITDAWTVLGKKDSDTVYNMSTMWNHVKNIYKPIYKEIDGDYIFWLFRYKVKYNDSESLKVFVTTDDEPIANLSANLYDDNEIFTDKDLATISQVSVFEDHQGQGLGKEMYKILIEHGNIDGIISDKTLTGEDRNSGSFKIWKWLSSIYDFYIYDTNKDKLTQLSKLDNTYSSNQNEIFVLLRRNHG